MRWIILAAPLLCGSAHAQITLTGAGRTGTPGGNTLTTSCAATAPVSSTIACSGTYTGATPTSIANGTWSGGGGTATVSGVTVSGGTWNATFTTPAAAGTRTLQACGSAVNVACGTSAGVTIGFIGILDAVPGAKVLYSLECGSSAQATGTTKVVNYRRASDNATQDGVCLTTGAFDAASAATFAGTDATCTGTISGTTLSVSSCASGTLHIYDPISGAGIVQPAFITNVGSCATPPGTCTLNASQTVAVAETITAQVALFITTLYDLGSSGTNATQSTPVNQIPLLLTCANSQACMHILFQQWMTLSFPFTAQPITMSAVAIREGNFTVAENLFVEYGSSDFTQFAWQTSVNTVGAYAGTTSITTTASDGVWHSFQAIYNDPSSAVNVDNTTTTGSIGTRGMSGTTSIGAYAGPPTNYMTGSIKEIGWWPSAFTAPQQTSACNSQFTRYATAVSC